MYLPTWDKEFGSIFGFAGIYTGAWVVASTESGSLEPTPMNTLWIITASHGGVSYDHHVLLGLSCTFGGLFFGIGDCVSVTELYTLPFLELQQSVDRRV